MITNYIARKRACHKDVEGKLAEIRDGHGTTYDLWPFVEAELKPKMMGWAKRCGNLYEADDFAKPCLDALAYCAERWEAGRGMSFMTLLKNRAHTFILDFLRTQDVLPRLSREKYARILAHADEHDLSYARAAEALGISAIEAVELRRMRVVASTEHLIYERGVGGADRDPVTLGEVTPANVPQPHENIELEDNMGVVFGLLDGREKLIFSLYYFDQEPMRNVALIVGCSESRVCQIHTRALKKLRAALSGREDLL
jgi:RNA polymerase sigma factor for flagellar operon FliA